MDWKQLVVDVRNAYRAAPDQNSSIATASYLALLNAFDELSKHAAIPPTYDTDFRRNLPGGGISGFKVTTLSERINDARSFAKSNPLYPTAGECVAENIRALFELELSIDPAVVLAPIQATLQGVKQGQL